MHIRFSLFLVLLVPLAVGLTSYADRNAYQDNSGTTAMLYYKNYTNNITHALTATIEVEIHQE